MYVRMYVVHVCMHVFMQVWTCIYVRMYKCVQIVFILILISATSLFRCSSLCRGLQGATSCGTLIEFGDRIKISSVTGKVNNNINKEFWVNIYETESGITYPLLLLLYFNNCCNIILFLDWFLITSFLCCVCNWLFACWASTLIVFCEDFVTRYRLYLRYVCWI